MRAHFLPPILFPRTRDWSDPTLRWPGATLLDAYIGHNLSAIIHALGPLSSLSSTTAQAFPTVTFLSSSGAPSGKTEPSSGPDQFAFTGILKDSGAVLTATWRGGVPSMGKENDARPTFLWVVDGEKGFIRIEGTGPGGAVLQIYEPQKVMLNGEEVSLATEGEAANMTNTARAFEEFAKGEGRGMYPTFDDAVVVHEHIEAIRKSAAEGKRVDVGL